MTALHLQVVNVGDCTPAKPLYALQNLRTLKLMHNTVTAEELSAIAANCTQLTGVHLGYRMGITGGTDHAAEAASGWQNLPLSSLAITGSRES